MLPFIYFSIGVLIFKNLLFLYVLQIFFLVCSLPFNFYNLLIWKNLHEATPSSMGYVIGL